MAQTIYKVTPLDVKGNGDAGSIDSSVVDLDNVPKLNAQGLLRDWISTPMGQAYYAWVKQTGLGWVVTDMFQFQVYKVGTGPGSTYWVPAKFQIVGHRNDYYIHLLIIEDLDAEAAMQAAEIEAARARAAALAAAQGVNNPAAGPAGGNPYVSGGISMGAMGSNQPRRAYELTMLRDGRFFYALSDAESKGLESPHTGISVAGANKWPGSFGKPSDQGLPDGLYLLSVDPADASPQDAAQIDTSTGVPSVVVPAARAYKALIAAAQRGDAGAMEAAQALSIDIPRAAGARGVLQELEDLFG